MVQRYMPSVEDEGERALVWIDGRFTHAVRKAPRFDGQDESVSEALELAPDELAFGERVMAQVQGDVLYARVDVMHAADGGLLLSELELIEPSLFLLQSPSALDRLVRAILARL